MPLKPETALRKDRSTRPVTMQHRHYATIAAIIAEMPNAYGERDTAACYFARRLRDTNPNFDRQRFIAACEPED